MNPTVSKWSDIEELGSGDLDFKPIWPEFKSSHHL